jgi:hypothetical protein
MSTRAASLHDSLANVADPILRESLCCLLTHFHPKWGDREPLDVLNRLLAKNLGRAGPYKTGHTTARLEQISSRREHWTTADLGRLRRGHSDLGGVDIACPIVLLEYAGETRVLDGNHRINRWVRANDSRTHAVNIHTIAESVDVVNLLPAANDA